MRTISTALQAEFADEQSQGYVLVKVSMGSTYRYTDCDIDLYYNGDRYIAKGFALNGIEQSPGFASDSISLDIDNVDRTFSAIVLSEDAANAPISVYYQALSNTFTSSVSADGVEFVDGDVVFTDDDFEWDSQLSAGISNVIGTLELYNGFLSEWNLDEQRIRLKIGSEFMFWHKKSLRLPTPNCPWAFKGTECGYAGGETLCDKSPERCSGLGNYVNFGGRKFVSDVEEKEIYWGPK
jgi:hypothetical protein